jgi:hypothetical protein
MSAYLIPFSLVRNDALLSTEETIQGYKKALIENVSLQKMKYFKIPKRLTPVKT